MPRGKYDRKESRIHRLERDLAERDEKLKTITDELAKRDVELKAAKKIADVVAKVGPMPAVVPSEKFVILRDNLRILSESRRVLVDSDQVSPAVLTELDSEISAHLKMLGALRQETFRVVQGEFKNEVPLPTQAPAYPALPQAFTSAKHAVGG